MIVPNIIPKIIKNLSSPSQNLYIEYIIIIPVNIQNKKSCMHVIISLVLYTFLKILKVSNNSPIIAPTREKIIKRFA